MANYSALQLEEQATKYCLDNKFKEAQEVYSSQIELLRKTPDSDCDRNRRIALAFNNRGLCKYKQVYFEEAILDYSTALQYDLDLAVAYYNRATIHYRLCNAKEANERTVDLESALNDFKKALSLQPTNMEFQKGLESCKELLEDTVDDGNASSTKKFRNNRMLWSAYPPETVIKLLFLLDNGDKSTGKGSAFQQYNTNAVLEANDALVSFLKSEKIIEVEKVLNSRVSKFQSIPFVSETEIAKNTVTKFDEDLLTFTEACHVLNILCEMFDEKKKHVQEKLFLDEEERRGSFFIYAENLRICHISEQLSPCHVYRLFESMKEDKDLNHHIHKSLNVSLSHLHKVKGLKEALFFYVVRLLEIDDKLNRIYTRKLEELLEQVNNVKSCQASANKCQPQDISRIISVLSLYPTECQPTGLCIVFCVTKDRDGADGEIKKVKRVFKDSLGYSVKVEENPTSQTIETYREELKKEKYRFYDSFVFWFMSHGTGTDIKLGDGQFYKRKKLIDEFCRLDNFRKKPKIFFMASCLGDKAIPTVKNEGGLLVAADGIPGGEDSSYAHIPESFHNITAVHYEMDRLIASATLPDRYSFRIPKEGSAYVDTVCCLLEKHKGENITQILEKACNKMHQILFSAEECDGLVKQGCYYESTFQKTFIVTSGGKQ